MTEQLKIAEYGLKRKKLNMDLLIFFAECGIFFKLGNRIQKYCLNSGLNPHKMEQLPHLAVTSSIPGSAGSILFHRKALYHQLPYRTPQLIYQSTNYI